MWSTLWFVAAVLLVISLLGRRQRPEPAVEPLPDECETKDAVWRQRVANARHMLTGASWRDGRGKASFVQKLFDGIPGYLWYAVGNAKPSAEDVKRISLFFWGVRGPDFGDLEWHRSANPEVGVSLRIRNPERFTSELVLDGQDCPLYQVGHSYCGDLVDGCVTFFDLYGRQTAPIM